MAAQGFPFYGRDPKPAELIALGGDYAEIAAYAEANPLHAHFRAWGVWCREHGDFLVDLDGADGPARPLNSACPNCDQDRWFVVETPDDEDWSAEHCCQCCGFMSPVWRND